MRAMAKNGLDDLLPPCAVEVRGLAAAHDKGIPPRCSGAVARIQRPDGHGRRRERCKAEFGGMMFHVFVANHCSGHARVAPPRRFSGARGMDSIAPEGCCVIRTPLGNESKLYAPTRVGSREKTSVRGVLDSLGTPRAALGRSGSLPALTLRQAASSITASTRPHSKSNSSLRSRRSIRSRFR